MIKSFELLELRTSQPVYPHCIEALGKVSLIDQVTIVHTDHSFFTAHIGRVRICIDQDKFGQVAFEGSNRPLGTRVQEE